MSRVVYLFFFSVLRFHDQIDLLSSSSGRRIGAFCTVEADSEIGDLIIDSSSHPVVTGTAYLPSLAGGASLREERSSYRPSFAGGTS
jgi:hypothetical protein